MPQEFTPQYNFTDDRLNELKQLFPEAWEDGVFNVDTLKTLIGDFSTDNTVKEHFGLNWVGKQDARKIAAKPPTGTLKPCLGEGVNEDTTENIFIEGENLEVLKILRKSYMGKIKMIYIDPPYNTGNDFIYNDTFADSTEDYLRKTGEKSDEGLLVSNPKSSGKYHANWLTFMYPRLRLAKDLLKDDGVVFISIDDNEIDNLRLMCDEIFGEENFIEQIIWKNKYGAGAKTKGFISTHEYILCYSKTPISDLTAPLPESEVKKHSRKDEKFEIRGGYRLQPLQTRSLGDRPTLVYPVVVNGITVMPNKQWVWSEKRLLKAIEDNNVEIREKEGKITIDSKQYLKDENGKMRRGKPVSVLIGPYTQDGTKEIRELFDSKDVFNFPKPSKLIETLLDIEVGNEDSDQDLIMDFFAGSGTTAHSILNFNYLNKTNKKFICVQVPELIEEKHISYKLGYKKITELTKLRIKKVIENSGLQQGFKVYKQDTSTIYKWQDFKSEQDGALPDLFSKMELAYKNPLQDGVTTQDFITEVILQEGFPLTAKQEEVGSGIFKITHEWLPYTLYATMLYSFKNTDFSKLQLQDTDHFVCLDKAFEGNDALKQEIDNQCKLFTI